MVALGEAAAALRSEAEAGQQHARDAEVLAGMAGAASEKLEAQLKEASAENDQLAAAAARVRNQIVNLFSSAFAPPLCFIHSPTVQ